MIDIKIQIEMQHKINKLLKLIELLNIEIDYYIELVNELKRIIRENNEEIMQLKVKNQELDIISKNIHLVQELDKNLNQSHQVKISNQTNTELTDSEIMQIIKFFSPSKN